MAPTRCLRGAIPRLLLTTALCWLAQAVAQDPVFRVVHSVDEVAASVERARHVSAVLLLSSQSDAKLRELAQQNGGAGDDVALVHAIETQFPHVRKVVLGLHGAVEVVVADIADAAAITKKWNVASLPALVVYKDAPKKNPYTGKMYRDATLTPLAVLGQPRELKKLLRESISSQYVAEWTTLNGVTTLQHAQQQREKNKLLCVLVSKQSTASPLFRALSVELAARRVAFAFVSRDDAVAEELMEAWKLEKLPAIVVVQSMETMDDRVVLDDENKMKTFADLKSFVEPFAAAEEEDASSSDAQASKDKETDGVPLLTAATFEDLVINSKLVWIVSFLDAKTEAGLDKKAWKKLMGDVQKRAGIVAVGAVSCPNEPALCKQYAVGNGGLVRVFPVVQNPTSGEIDRGEVLAETFKSVEEAKEIAIESIPDLVQVMGSSAELNAFVSRALAAKAMPIVYITSKMQTPPIIKSLALSFPTQNIAVGVVSDMDPQVKQQFNLAPSSKASLVCLVAVDKQENVENQPANSLPFGIISYDKKIMGPYSYANMVRFLMSVLAQYPHPMPLSQTEGKETELSDLAVSLEAGEVPYLHEDNLVSLCGGNKICAIGFFEGHVDTLSDDTSPLSKAVGVLSQVAVKSKKARQPFHFMWTNGKCQSAFAESFGVGGFQMPTVVVYSPSKARYATNIGVFDEANTAAFLKSVLSGKIVTAPLKDIGELRAECSLEEISDDAASVAFEEETDDDLGDLLSEILGDEEEQRRQLQDELAAERKASKTQDKGSKSKKDKKKKKKGKKGKKKASNDRDEL